MAVNGRINHIHTVAASSGKRELALGVFKANATRQMRENGCWPHSRSPWAEKGGRLYLWTEKHVSDAIPYLVNGQGGFAGV